MSPCRFMYWLSNVHGRTISPTLDAGHMLEESDPSLQPLESCQNDVLFLFYFFPPRWYFKISVWIESCSWWSLQDDQMPDVDLDVTNRIQPDEPTVLSTSASELNSVFGKDYRTLRDILISANPASPPLPFPPLFSPPLSSPIPCLRCTGCSVTTTGSCPLFTHIQPSRVCQKTFSSALANRLKNSFVVNISWVLL